MEDLALWLETNLATLVEAAANELTQTEQLRATVTEATEAFYDAVLRTIRMDSSVPLNLILLDWVEARSAPTEEEPTGLLSVLHTLKDVLWNQICDNNQTESRISWLTAIEKNFATAAENLSRFEAEALVADTRAELNIALINIDRLNKGKSDFIAVAAHELKTPLTLIEGYSNMLRTEFPEAEYPRVAMMLSGIRGGTVRLREIVQDMIDVTTIEMHLLELNFQPVWLHRLIDILEFEVSDTIKGRGQVFTIDRASLNNQPTYADPERLYQVLYKVVSNAIKYTPDGGRISLRSRDLPGFTEIVVEDTGIGIAAEDLQRIFEKFSSLVAVSLHSSSKTEFKGAGPGLGLAIAKGIIEEHGGTIWAESTGYDEDALPGCTFHIMVPMRSAPSDDQMAELFTNIPSTPKKQDENTANQLTQESNDNTDGNTATPGSISGEPSGR